MPESLLNSYHLKHDYINGSILKHCREIAEFNIYHGIIVLQTKITFKSGWLFETCCRIVGIENVDLFCLFLGKFLKPIVGHDIVLQCLLYV